MATASELLLVSSDKLRQTELGRVLGGAGFNIRWTQSVEDALAAAQSRRFDAVLADHDLPPSGAWKELLAGLRSFPNLPPVLITCPRTEPALWTDALDAGACDVILRPFERMEVLCALKFARPVPARGEGAFSVTILIIEAPVLQTFLRVALSREGFRVLTPDPATALRVLPDLNVGMVITDEPECVAKVRPDVRILYLSAIPDAATLRRLPNPSVGFLQKPFRLEQLRAEVLRLCCRKAVRSVPGRPNPGVVSVREKSREPSAG